MDGDGHITRRQWIKGTLAASLLVGSGCTSRTAAQPAEPDASVPASEEPEPSGWAAVREEFDATDEVIHMAGMLIAAHPRAVRAAIDYHRRGLDEDPTGHLLSYWGMPPGSREDCAHEQAVRAAGSPRVGSMRSRIGSPLPRLSRSRRRSGGLGSRPEFTSWRII